MAEDDPPPGRSSGRREVVVPLAVYKAVVVFSTLFAVVSVVAGFLVLDAATRRATLPASAIDPVLAGAGLALIGLGAVVYAFASRFRAPGMGKDKAAAEEGSTDG